MHVSTVHPAFDVRIFHKQCRSLAQAGADVYLLVQHDQACERDGVKILPLPRFTSRWQRFWRGSWLVAKAAGQLKPALVHIHDPELLPVAAWLRLCGYKVIFDMHENMPQAVYSRYWIPRVLRPVVAAFVKTAEKLLLRGIPVIFAEDAYARDYPWLVCSATVLNMPIVDAIILICERKHSVPTVGYFGSITAERGLFVTTEALCYLAAAGRKLNFDCVGNFGKEKDRHKVERQLFAAGVSVSFPGRVDAIEGWKRMARCHLGLAILQAEPNYIESYPTKLFEYMGLGLPVIASNFPLYRAVVEKHDCGLCVDPNDPIALANAIAHLLDNPDLASAMGERGRRAVQQYYSWSRELTKLFVLYTRVLHRCQ